MCGQESFQPCEESCPAKPQFLLSTFINHNWKGGGQERAGAFKGENHVSFQEFNQGQAPAKQAP